jgi:hypothetical protein
VRILAFVTAALLVLGEIARWWGQPRFLPMAFDELIVAAALAIAAWGVPRWGPAPLAAAWGVFCGLILSLLVPTLDHLLFGEPKESAILYATILSAMLAVGAWATLAAIRLSRAP